MWGIHRCYVTLWQCGLRVYQIEKIFQKEILHAQTFMKENEITYLHDLCLLHYYFFIPFKICYVFITLLSCTSYDVVDSILLSTRVRTPSTTLL